jgi:hypothetical protein
MKIECWLLRIHLASLRDHFNLREHTLKISSELCQDCTTLNYISNNYFSRNEGFLTGILCFLGNRYS